MTQALPRDGDDPLESFLAWHAQARGSEPLDGAACCLATAGANGAPSARMVLFRGLHHGRFSFYTNLESAKAAQLRENPLAAMLFHWPTLGRQLRVEGTVAELPTEASDRYFATRPRGSQLGAWASPQSRALASREELSRRMHEIESRFGDGEIPRPRFWGGFGLAADRIEFWVQGDDRLHHRRNFVRRGDRWSSELLAP